MISEAYHAQVDLLLQVFKQGKPDWSLLPLENLSRMPAVQWKLINIRKLLKQNPDKHAEQLKALEDRLAG